jgi:putative SOS response-associated peptidase YedK
MCGFYLFEPGHNFYEIFDIKNRLDFLPTKIEVAPGKIVPIIFNEGVNVVQPMKWGLIPFWAKEQSIGKNMFNARAESVVEKPAFKKAYKTQRCIVPSNGFYEWKSENGKKIPYFFEVKNRPNFGFAGLYDIWEEPVGGREIYTYTIVTTSPNEVVKPIHDRMPVILKKDDEVMWLDKSTSLDTLQRILFPSKERIIAKQQKP